MDREYIEILKRQKAEAIKSHKLITKQDERVCDKGRVIPVRKG